VACPSPIHRARVLMCVPCVLFLCLVGCGRYGYDQSPETEIVGFNIDGGQLDSGAQDGATDGDVPLVCVDSTCDLWLQCGCDADQKCDSDGAGTRTCETAGTALHAESCTSTNDCSSGTTCLSMAGWPVATEACFQYCNVDADCSALARGAFCRLSAAGAFNACTLPCDPLAQTGCPAQTQCSVYNFGSIGGTNCTGPGTVPQGQTCNSHFDCVESMLCVSGSCQQLCVVGDNSPCGGATTCQSTGIVNRDIVYGACL
jgi:hypothetical protein